MTDSIRITVLCEDQAQMGFMDKKFFGQHGLSLFIEADIRILFDVGPSAVVLENASLSGIDLSLADRIVLSHGHWDHCDGLLALAEAGVCPPVMAHPGVFADRHKSTGPFNGMAMPRADVRKNFGLVESRSPVRLSDSVWFLGEIPRTTSFESVDAAFWAIGADGEKIVDDLPDDTALAVATARGTVVVTGCSHAGICNICRHAKTVTGQSHIHAVVGGFHLLQAGTRLEKTVAFLTAEKIDRLYPMHCTALPALSRFYNAFGIGKLCAGDVLAI